MVPVDYNAATIPETEQLQHFQNKSSVTPSQIRKLALTTTGATFKTTPPRARLPFRRSITSVSGIRAAVPNPLKASGQHRRGETGPLTQQEIINAIRESAISETKCTAQADLIAAGKLTVQNHRSPSSHDGIERPQCVGSQKVDSPRPHGTELLAAPHAGELPSPNSVKLPSMRSCDSASRNSNTVTFSNASNEISVRPTARSTSTEDLDASGFYLAPRDFRIPSERKLAALALLLDQGNSPQSTEKSRGEDLEFSQTPPPPDDLPTPSDKDTEDWEASFEKLKQDLYKADKMVPEILDRLELLEEQILCNATIALLCGKLNNE